VKREFKARLILASALIGGFAFAAEPRITLSAENQPLGQVLQSIEKQSGFSVVLNDKKWSEDIVTLSVKNLELEKALGVVFGGYNYVLAFEANKGGVSKVLVTVYEKKEGVAMPVVALTAPIPMPQAMLKPANNRPLDYSKIKACPLASGTTSNLTVADMTRILNDSGRVSVRKDSSAFPPGSSLYGVSFAKLDEMAKMLKPKERGVE
jgi:hypothetical protein